MRKRTILLASLTSAAILPAAPAFAQNDEIIVTARKREESVLKVPVIETVITQATLERKALSDLPSISTKVPGFVIGSSFGPLGAQANIRGIGVSAVNAMIDQSVSLNLDGLPLSQGLAYSAGMFDVAQVEVLKGPQALFYGKNSPAGVISIRTADPTDKTEIILRTGYEFEANERMGEAIVSGALTSGVKARLAAHFSDMDGFFHNDAVAAPGLGGRTPDFRNFAPDRNLILRGTLLLDPSSGYTVRLKGNYSKEELRGSGGDLQIGYCPTGVTSTLGIPFVNATENCKLDRTLGSVWFDPAVYVGIPNGGEPFADTKQVFGTAEQNLVVGDGLTLASVSAYYKVDSNSLFNGSANSGVPLLGSNNRFSNEQFTQELRLTSDFRDSPLNFMVGGFYQDATLRNRLRLFGNTKLRLPLLIQNVANEVNVESYSAFGQLTYKVLDTLEIAAGARWTHEKRTHAEENFSPVSGALGPVDLLVPRISSSNLSPELTVTYTPSDDMTLFASFKKGFKSGSFNTAAYTSPTTDASFGDERVIGGEAGLKARFLDRSVTFNLSGYYYKYNDLQVGATERREDGIVATRTLNAASAKVYGVELEANYAPPSLPGLQLHAAANLNHARYGTFDNAPCGGGQTIGQGCDQILDPTKVNSVTGVAGLFTAQDLSGEELVRAPDLTFNIGADYETEVGGGRRLALGTSLYHTSSYLTQLSNQPGFRQEDYVKVDANIALSGRDDAWEIALIGKNLNNRITANNCFIANVRNSLFGGQVAGGTTSGPAGGDGATCLADRGRQLWVRLTLRPLGL